MTAGFRSALFYQDPKAALAWLEKAFGFELTMLLEDAEGNVAHSQMSFGNGYVMIGQEWSADHKSPKSVGGKNTQTVNIQIETSLRDARVSWVSPRSRRSARNLTPNTLLLTRISRDRRRPDARCDRGHATIAASTWNVRLLTGIARNGNGSIVAAKCGRCTITIPFGHIARP